MSHNFQLQAHKPCVESCSTGNTMLNLGFPNGDVNRCTRVCLRQDGPPMPAWAKIAAALCSSLHFWTKCKESTELSAKESTEPSAKNLQNLLRPRGPQRIYRTFCTTTCPQECVLQATTFTHVPKRLRLVRNTLLLCTIAEVIPMFTSDHQIIRMSLLGTAH